MATLTPRKGHLLLVEALAALQHLPWQLHCVGSTTRDPDTTAAVRAAIAARGLQHRVLLHGERDGAALAAAYVAADVFVLPSYHEGYGMALAEALAHGLPVVSTTAGAIADTVPASAGMLVPPGDAEALRRALARLIAEPAWRALLASGARAAGARLPSWEQAAAQLATVLCGVGGVGGIGGIAGDGGVMARPDAAAAVPQDRERR